MRELKPGLSQRLVIHPVDWIGLVTVHEEDAAPPDLAAEARAVVDKADPVPGISAAGGKAPHKPLLDCGQAKFQIMVAHHDDQDVACAGPDKFGQGVKDRLVFAVIHDPGKGGRAVMPVEQGSAFQGKKIDEITIDNQGCPLLIAAGFTQVPDGFGKTATGEKELPATGQGEMQV